jgi:hypothetical protein
MLGGVLIVALAVRQANHTKVKTPAIPASISEVQKNTPVREVEPQGTPPTGDLTTGAPAVGAGGASQKIPAQIPAKAEAKFQETRDSSKLLPKDRKQIKPVSSSQGLKEAPAKRASTPHDRSSDKPSSPSKPKVQYVD